ncbi:MAG: amidohydrolase [Dehalococcoidia bacterium]|nr:amidohydrolase [Dehalococcoidia bacterium]
MKGPRMPDKTQVIDSHHHFWDLTRFAYPWMPQEDSVLKRTYGPPELAPSLEETGVDKTVIVQAHQSVDETRWLLKVAHESPFVAGVVGWVDLTGPGLGDVLDELQRDVSFKGVRHIWHDEAADDWLARPAAVRGLKEVARRGLAYDFLVRPQHLKYVPQIIDAVPDLRAVIDHIAKPLIKERGIEPWLSDLRRVANVTGIMCKVSGMVTEADHRNWTPQDLRPYTAHVVGMFGWDRLMFGSDWPVCLLAGSYAQVIGAARANLEWLKPHERDAVFGGNAARFYNLGADRPSYEASRNH